MLQMMNDTMDPTLSGNAFVEQYVPLVEFLGQAMGPNVEIVLHDLDVPDKSIVAIANSHISGRELGGPVTDFALWFMKQGDAARVPMMTGYRAVNAEGRICRSSSYFLRDATNHMRAMLCINVDITELVQIRNSANFLINGTEDSLPDKSQAFGGYPAAATVARPAPTAASPVSSVSGAHATGASSTLDDDQVVTESLRSNVQHLLGSMMDTAIAKQGVTPERMQRDERIEVVRSLEDAGFFLLKGGIAAAAERLDVSEPTIYRYLVQVRG